MSRAKPKPAEKKPTISGKLVNRAELAAIFGVSTNTVTSWTARGCPHVQAGGLGKAWTFDTAAVAQWQAQRSPASGQVEDPDERELRKRKLAVDLAQAELELAKDQGELVNAEEVRREAYTLARTMRDAFQNLPDRLADELAAETDAGAIHHRLETELKSILRQLAE